ncbi:MAG: helix-turn-helix transcriptional regulator, partial [Paracoccaceae bacterium]
MDRPPILTARQRDLLPYLISGCTRAEIANALNISEETVRKHVRNILELFEAVNIRDAMIDMVQYNTFYGDDGPHYHYYVDRNEVSLTHLDDGETTVFEVDQDFYIMAGELSEVLDRFRTNGTLVSHTCNGQEQVPFETSMGLKKYRYVLSEPVKSGGVFNRYKRYVIKNAFPEQNFWQIGTRAPTRELNFTIRFAPNRP